MINSQKIADKLIAASRGILSRPDKTQPIQAPVPHVMSVAAYEKRFGAKGEGK